MPPTVELVLRFDGSTPGLAEHVLSLAAFKKSLPLLLTAFQKTFDIVAGRPEDEAEGKGPSAKGRSLDLQIKELSGNSLALKLVVAFTTASEPSLMPEFETDLVARTAERFTNDIKAEWENRGSRESVRRYMSALPGGLAKQEYEAFADGKIIGRASLSTRNEVQLPGQLIPRSREIRGTIYGVTFDESTARVKIRDSAGVIHTCRAVPDVVELAVAFRRAPVIGMVLIHKDESRLLTLRAAGTSRSNMSSIERLAFLTEHWKETLKKLAE